MMKARWLRFLGFASVLAVVGLVGVFILTPDASEAFVYEAVGIVMLALIVAYWLVLRRGDSVGVLMK